MIPAESFRPRPWPVIRTHYEELVDGRGLAYLEPLLAVVGSIMEEDHAGYLRGATSMYDLLVTLDPVSEPMEFVRVRVLSETGVVRITHELRNGPGDSIERPADEAIALFWRFMIEKYGVRPARDYR